MIQRLAPKSIFPKSPHGGLKSQRVRHALYYANKRRKARAVLAGSPSAPEGAFSAEFTTEFD